MILWLPFDDKAPNTVVADASGNGYDGALVGANTEDISVVGRVGGGFDLAESYYISVPDAPIAALNGSVSSASVCFRVKRNSTPGYYQYLYYFTYGGNYAKLYSLFYADGTIRFGVRDSTLNLQAITTNDSLIDTSAWHHLAYVVDLANEQMLVYLDGELLTSTGSVSFPAGVFPNGTGNCQYIGADYSESYAPDAAIDDFRLYRNEALSQEKIKEIVADRRGRYAPWEPHVVEPTTEEVMQYGH